MRVDSPFNALTTLCRAATPIHRYRTRGLTTIIEEPCACGRTHRRIERITGSADDMPIVRGVTSASSRSSAC